MSTPEKVWIVTKGEYSAYQIVAVFLTVEEARAFVGDAASGEYGAPCVEEWVLGTPEGWRFQKTYQVWLHLDTGSLKQRDESYEQHPKDHSYYQVWSKGSEPVAFGESVISEDHALRLAAEARQRWLRERDAAAGSDEKRDEGTQ